MLARRRVWKRHPIYDAYEFSTTGGARRTDGKPVRCYFHRRYWQVHIKCIGQRRLHVCILETFRGLRPEGLLGCHDNDNPNDNRLSNLKWKTHSQNVQDRYLNGYTHSEQSRALMRASKLGIRRVFTDEWRANLGASAKGRVPSAATRAKIGAAHIGKVYNPWGRAGKPK